MSISEERKQRLTQVFNKYDSDGNGFIDRYELPKLLKKIFSGEEVSEEHVQTAMKILDVNSDGQISFNEFLIFMIDFVGEYSDDDFNKGIEELLN